MPRRRGLMGGVPDAYSQVGQDIGDLDARLRTMDPEDVDSAALALDLTNVAR